MSEIGKIHDCEKPEKNSFKKPDKKMPEQSDGQKLKPKADSKDPYAGMSDKEFEKYVKDLDKNTAPTNILDNGKKPKRDASPLNNQERNHAFSDAWGNKNLKNGDKLYALGTKDNDDNAFYTDRKTVDSCRNKDGSVNYDKLKDKLQINDPDGKKNTLREYDVNKDLTAPGGRAKENDKWGKGGGRQYFLSDDDRKNLGKGKIID